ncbi:linoleate diol synthase [Pseudovirgaria hyperparasitica]|uniref:Linoleate diol synthase n=1 Tax=Pseudovirgaria hyperparasitica TaxID=470096 RepID=A0A6A6WK75_9PEZI|nr:linoleate diol synthase [Pseudovirgaria hyperparasitica]KAF2762562.1 linoleate diol synthase [Pseudovirgaria hyperparasitica]
MCAGDMASYLYKTFQNAKTIFQVLLSRVSGQPIDDRALLLEGIVSLLQDLPSNSPANATISSAFIRLLWHEVPHPSATLIGPESRYRRPDASGNNPWMPMAGKAGSPYARNVAPSKPRSHILPDPELVFDALLVRNGPFRAHPSGLNRLFFSFATIVIHECFQSSYKEPWRNEASSYVDLSTLYGNSDAEQHDVRTFENGRIYPDTFASKRLLMMPPGVATVLLLFSRNHNRIAENLLQINEEGKYGSWKDLDKDQKQWQDEDIFQTARNINVGYLASVVLRDYVAAILNTTRANSDWWLDLGQEMKEGTKRTERGSGNTVSVEFSVLYRWHACVSAADDEWMKKTMSEAAPQLTSQEQLTPEMLHGILAKRASALNSIPCKEWTFGGLERGPDGSFCDKALGNILKDCIEEPAHAFGAHGSPASFKIVEVLGQIQAREHFKTCTMNEFRRYLHLKPYKSFTEWNPDTAVAHAAETLYGNIESLELYPGLMAEETKPATAGSGLCPGQTMGRGLLNDAVALIRGDRFLSHNFNSTSLTNWGFSKLKERQPGSGGFFLPGLMLRALPSELDGTSLYGLMPFYTPTAAMKIFEGRNELSRYSIERPLSDRLPIILRKHQSCNAIFQDSERYVIWNWPARRHTGATSAATEKHIVRDQVLNRAFFEQGFEIKVLSFVRFHVRRYIQERSHKFNGGKRSIDIVNDVTNRVPIDWIAQKLAVPIKADKSAVGLHTQDELREMLLGMFAHQTLNNTPEKEWCSREVVTQAVEKLETIVESHLKIHRMSLDSLTSWIARDTAFESSAEAVRLYCALGKSSISPADLPADWIAMAASLAGNMTNYAAYIIDLLLSPKHEKAKNRIVELVHMGEGESTSELLRYVYECVRLCGAVPGFVRTITRHMSLMDDDGKTVDVTAGDKVFVVTSEAAVDPSVYPDPLEIHPDRTTQGFQFFGPGTLSESGIRCIAYTLMAVLREVFRLKNVRRAAGPRGRFCVVENNVFGVPIRSFIDADARECPYPTSLVLEYDP